MAGGKLWSSGDIEYLTENYKTDIQGVATKLDRSVKSVHLKAWKLGLNNRKWEDEEVSMLFKMYPYAEKKDIIEQFNRKWTTIHAKARTLGLVRDKNKNILKTTEEFIVESNKIHSNEYDYSKSVYTGANDKLIVICKIHGEFTCSARSHMRSSKFSSAGCPRCSQSYPEKRIMVFLLNKGINVESEKRFDQCKSIAVLPFDFYLTDLNICIEFDGKHHYENVYNVQNWKTPVHDAIKTKYCLENKIKLIRIPYWEMNNIETILEKELL